jgi:hypothetical protein
MGRHEKNKWKSLPIEAFETIGERCKANRRTHNSPKRFHREFHYLPKGLIKSEPKFSQEWNHLQSLHNKSHFHLYQNQTFRRKRAQNYGNRKTIVKNGINNETIDPNIKRVAKEELNSSDSDNEMAFNSFFNQNNGEKSTNNFNTINVMTSTPKSINQRIESKNSSIDSMEDLYEMPPDLQPVSISDEELATDDDMSSPPILIEKTIFYNNINDNSNENLDKRKSFKSDREMDLRNELRAKEIKYNLEIETIGKQLLETKQENDLLRNQLIKTNDEFKKSNFELNRMKVQIQRLRNQLIQNQSLREEEINGLKRTHWCFVCLKEAFYYCCWTGIYC